MIPCKVILCPTDLSKTASHSYEMACSIARNQRAHLIMLHVTPKGVAGYVDEVSELPTPEVKERLWEAMHWPRAEEAGLDIEHRVEEGDAAEQINRVARESGCDLIVISPQPTRAVARWFTSSVTESVLRDSPCSVLVVKSAEVPAPEEDDPEVAEPGPSPEAIPPVLIP